MVLYSFHGVLHVEADVDLFGEREKGKYRQRHEVQNETVAVADAAGGPTEPTQVQITGHYWCFLQNAEIKQPVIGSLPVATVPVTSGIQHTSPPTGISALYLLVRSKNVCLLLSVPHLYG